MLHLYRIYQLEEVIHENLRPEKSQEIQKVGGKRKSYKLDPNNTEAKSVTKNPRRKKTKKDAIGPTKHASVEVGVDVNVERGAGGAWPKGEASIPTSRPDGGAGQQKPDVVSARGRRKRQSVTNAGPEETGVAKTVRKRKKPKAESEQADDEAEHPQAKQQSGRKRRRETDS